MSKTALYNGLSASEEEISKTQTSGYLLFMQAALVLFAINYLTNGCKIEIGTFHWQDKAILQTEGWDLWSIFHDSKLLASFDFWQAWKSLYMHFLVTFGWVWGNGNLVVGLYRIMGFSVLRNTQKVWASVSTLDYFQRFAYYFRKTLQRFFFYPALFNFSRYYLDQLFGLSFGSSRSSFFLINFNIFRILPDSDDGTYTILFSKSLAPKAEEKRVLGPYFEPDNYSSYLYFHPDF